MIQHIALFRFKPATEPTAIKALMDGLTALPAEISEIAALASGENFSDRADGHTHVATMRFASRDDLETFYAHPAHQQVIEGLIKPITDDLLIVDYKYHSTAPGDPPQDQS